MKYRSIVAAFAIVAFFTVAVSLAAMKPARTPAPATAAELAFVAKDSALLQHLYPTTAAAKEHGYIPLSAHFDSSHTQLYTDLRFDGVTLAHPNFLWYDRAGHLVGVDYELRKSVYAKPPHLAIYPVQASRWSTIGQHVHFAYHLHGHLKYGEGRAAPILRTAHLTAAALRAAKLLPAGASLVWASYHPAAWDLAMWTVPNPKGPFADLNPLVK